MTEVALLYKSVSEVMLKVYINLFFFTAAQNINSKKNKVV